ncbi:MULTISPECIES: peptide ABC transporter substrate-binding protein [unclassified Bacillus cereus group]|uniref:peptide ABC transporter substrate-binding protein n=1 Tax=unclassified Bacillus cereus group TaxID=2750818 RepID=UPI001F56CBDB|nr:MULTISPECIES: peptide ABC transporter substrate-binding protein [unclassified Bacillus cereus group]
MRKKLPIFVASTMAVSMVLGACSYQKDEPKAKGTSSKSGAKQVLNLIETQEIPTMDPALSADSLSAEVMNNTMEGLYRLGKGDKLVPGIATEFKKSDDGKKYTFTLRKDAKWSNGDPVTAKDFEYAWKRAIHPDIAAKSAYIMYDIKNAEKINKKEMAPDQLGVKAINEYTLEVELEHAVPYFVDLLIYPLFYPVNEKYVTEQGDKFGLEANTTLYNGPFVLSEWKHERSFQMKKNPSYWEHKEVKLEEVNFNIVKDTATPINLYETKAVDRAILLAEFIDKYKGKPDFKTFEETTVFFLRLNQKDPALANKNIRKAISLAFDRKPFVETILNNGSTAATGLIPGNFMFGPNKKDFRMENGDIVKPNIKEAQKYWEAGKKELSKNEIELELLNEDVELSKKTGEYLKGELEKNLPGLTLKIKQQPFAQKLKLEDAGDYVMSFTGWSADFPDPISYLDMFVTGGAQNKMGYSNPKYDEIIRKAKKDGNDINARWKSLLTAEKMLLEDATIVPVYQRGRAYLQRENVKNLYFHKYGGDFSLKWTSVK